LSREQLAAAAKISEEELEALLEDSDDIKDVWLLMNTLDKLGAVVMVVVVDPDGKFGGNGVVWAELSMAKGVINPLDDRAASA
jgi:hypothetical protein